MDVHHLYGKPDRPFGMRSGKWQALSGLWTYSLSSLSKMVRQFENLTDPSQPLQQRGKLPLLF